jgi:ubiquinone/menaquinone biosynthesis C-methylase UbiE
MTAVWSSITGLRGSGKATHRGEYITFEDGGFAASPSSRSEFAAKLSYEATALRRLLRHYTDDPIRRSLEIGCGYGRLSPWIANVSENAHAIDPNEKAIDEARTQYPDIDFRTELVQNTSFADGAFDVVVSWTVLQHVPPDSIRSACDEIQRVTAENGVVVLAEQTGDRNGPTGWGRSASKYATMLEMTVESTEPKPVEPTFDSSGTARSHPEDSVVVLSNS